ncbi:putative ubiquitin-conjugating enzyme [Leptomonas seymouri]|uniref:E2 ubiquitin-conjugating enzyme n=1 Tax=Leptomonas seymouri TaxID=5684 RepID=A0A0N0P683_LEPSE|nr:putative ubiquitin-conjugating enzyme [Leptomonas seymouri]|eukprot:KPI87336.1 putative ubiquitin-conjugating enzyme [Leptomonas seymouri]
MTLTAAGMRTLMRQMQEVQEHPVDGVQVRPSDVMSEYHFDLDGPEGTPFEAGRFHVVLIFDEQYPEVPPKGFFRTKIFHPNVSERGDICVNALKRDWSPNVGLRHILVIIRCLLIEPNPESALNEEAGRLLLEDYAAYERKATMCTAINASRPGGAARFTLLGDETKASASTKSGEDGAEGQTSAGGSRLTVTEANCHPGSTAAAVKLETTKKAAEKKKKALRRI